MSKTRTYRKKRGGQGFFQAAPPQASFTNIGNSASQTGQRIGQGLSGAWSGITNWFSNLVRPNNSPYGQSLSGYGQPSSGYGQPSSGFGYGGRRKKTRKARKY